MQHGGDPNLFDHDSKSLILKVMSSSRPDKDKKEEIQLLIDAGADLDYDATQTGSTALYRSISGGRYSVTLQLLEAGASYNYCWGTQFSKQTVLDFLVAGMSDITPPEEKENYAKVLAWLEADGADLEGARKDKAKRVQGGKQSPARVEELQKRYEDELAVKEKVDAGKK